MTRERVRTHQIWRMAALAAALVIALAGCDTTPPQTTVVYDGEDEVWVDDQGRELRPERVEDDADRGWRMRSTRRGAKEGRSW